MIAPPRWLMRTPVLERWTASVLKRYARTVRRRWTVERRFDRLLLIDAEETVGRGMLTRGLWEFRQIEMMERLARDAGAGGDAVFLDIGAYWGLYALYFEQLGLFAEVHAIEASRRNAVLLDANLRMNDLEARIAVHRIAASDAEGEIQLQENLGISRVVGSGGVPVPARPLDQVFGFRDRLLVIKIDVEGHELAVLDGMTELLASNRVVLQIEAFSDTYDEVSSRMQAAGLREAGKVAPDDYFFVSA